MENVGHKNGSETIALLEPSLHRRISRAAANVSALPLSLPLFMVIAFASRLAWFGNPVADYDEQLYSLVGARMLGGMLPYVDLWDRKPFGLFAIYAISRAFGGPAPVCFQLLAACFAGVGAWQVYRLALSLSERLTAAGCGLIYLFLLDTYGNHSGQSETFFLPLMLGMLMLLRDMPASAGKAVARCALAMTLGGLALQIKYTVLPQCLFFGAYALYRLTHAGLPRPHVLKAAAAFALLGVAPTFLIALFYAATGHFEAFFHANFVSFFERAPYTAGRFNLRILQIATPLLISLCGGVYMVLREGRLRDARLWNLCLLWAFASLASVFLPSTIYPYYFAALAPSAILVSVPLLDREGPLGPFPLIAVLAATFASSGIARAVREGPGESARFERLAEVVMPHVSSAGPTGCLFVFDGPTALYERTGGCLPSRFIYPDHLNNALEREALGVDQAAEVQRILATRPGVIVTSAEPVTPQNPASTEAVRVAIARDYRPLAAVELQGRSIRAWVRDARD